MITNFKIYENFNNMKLLCVKATDPHYHWKFTKGKKYKTYYSSHGLRLKDDENKFCGIEHWNTTKEGDNYIFKYADGIFTTDNSIENYEIRITANKYNI